MPNPAITINELIEQLPFVSGRPFATAGEHRQIGALYHIKKLLESDLIKDNLNDPHVAELKKSLETIRDAILAQEKPDSAEKRELMDKAGDSIDGLGLRLNHLMSAFIVDNDRDRGPHGEAYAKDEDLEDIKMSVEYLAAAMNLQMGYGIPFEVQERATNDAEAGRKEREEEARKAALMNQQVEEAPQNEQEQEVPQENQNVPQENQQVEEDPKVEEIPKVENVPQENKPVQDVEGAGNLNIDQEVKEAGKNAPKERAKPIDLIIQQARKEEAQLKQEIADNKKERLQESRTLYDYLEKSKRTLLGESDETVIQDYAMDMLAARMLTGAPRNKKSYLKNFDLELKFVTKEHFEEQVQATREFLEGNIFIQEAMKGTKEARIDGKSAWLRGMIDGGHGGKLEDYLRKQCCKLPANELAGAPERFRPTAKERIEYLQKQLSKIPKNERDDDAAKGILCEIAGIRAVVGAVRNHKESLEKPYDPEKAMTAASQMKPVIDKLVNITKGTNPGGTAKAALAGHGGKLEDAIRVVANTMGDREKAGLHEFYKRAPMNVKGRTAENKGISRDSLVSNTDFKSKGLT